MTSKETAVNGALYPPVLIDCGKGIRFLNAFPSQTSRLSAPFCFAHEGLASVLLQIQLCENPLTIAMARPCVWRLEVTISGLRAQPLAIPLSQSVIMRFSQSGAASRTQSLVNHLRSRNPPTKAERKGSPSRRSQGAVSMSRRRPIQHAMPCNQDHSCHPPPQSERKMSRPTFSG